MATQTVEPPKERRAGFLRGMANALWRAASWLSFSGLSLSFDPAFQQPCPSLSPIEKAWREADLRGLGHI
jgi:hypothetical protein